MATAIGEGCPAFFVLGEAGAGKTRLAREVLRTLEAEGWVTAGATATESARLSPLGALAHLLPAGVAERPADLVAATRDAIAERTGGRPIVLHVDDAHHLDPTSASLLVSLAESGDVRLVMTQRSGLAPPEAIVALRAADRAESIVLGALDVVAVDTLLHRVLGGPLDGVAEARITELAGGNPLYLRELVLGALADGTLREVAGVWRLVGDLPASAALGDRVLGRMAALSDGARDALELIAVGEPIGLDALEGMVDIELLEELEERALIRVDVEQRRNTVRLAHPVYGEILRTSMGRLRLRRLSRLHAEAVEATGANRRDDAARIVRWQLDAGVAPDLDIVLRGARLARHHADWPTTAALARVAVEAGAVDAAALLAEAHFELGEFDEVDAAVAAALARRDELSEEAFVQLSRSHALSLMWGHDDSEGSIAALRGVVDQVHDPVQQGLVAYSLSGLLAWAGHVEEALEVGEPLLDHPDPRVSVQGAQIVGLVAASSGPTGRAIDLADHWFPIHFSLPDQAGTNSPGNHLVIKSVALTHAGRLQEAGELAELGYGASVANRSLIGQMWFSLQLGRVALARGDALGARRWFREQVALCRGTGHRRPVATGLAGLAVAAAHLGEAEAAAAAFAELDAVQGDTIEIFGVEEARGRAWAAAVGGEPAEARRLLLEAAAAAEVRGIVLQGALARFDALRLGDPDQAGALVAAAPRCDSAIVDLAARWASAPNDADELRSVGEAFEATGCLMYAAEAFAAAAVAARRAGAQRAANADEQRADALARQCRGAATPGLTTVESVVPLTAREREIAVLVADGLTTKQVAERLYLSARTVSNHLQNAYTKLGISKRTELADALSRLGADPEEP